MKAFLNNYPYVKARYELNAGSFKEDIVGVVIHSGSLAANVAEYLSMIKLARKVSAHFSWHKGLGEFVQQVPLTHRAWHVGPGWNDKTIGIELPGPWNQYPRPGYQRILLQMLIGQLRDEIPTLQYIVRHETIDEKKKDPGPGVEDGWFDGLGLVLH